MERTPKRVIAIACLTFAGLALTGVAGGAFTGHGARSSGGAPAGYTGSPADPSSRTCTDCHGGSPQAPGSSLQVSVPGSYTPGQALSITVSGSVTGFQLSAVQGGAHIGSYSGVGGDTEFADGNTNYVTHSNNANSSWTFQWTAPAGASGDVTFWVTGVNPAWDVFARQVTIQRAAAAPVAEDDPAQTNEDTPVVIAVLANDSGDNLSVTDATQPANGSTAIQNDGTIQYTPKQDFNGQDTFRYTLSNGSLTDEATVTVTVLPVNDAPTAADDAAETAEDTAVDIAVLDNDADVEDGKPTVAEVRAPAHGTAALNGDGTVRYTPAPDFFGQDAFTYAVTDGELTAEATVVVTVTGVNDAPAAATVTAPADGVTVVVDGASGGSLAVSWSPATDPDGDDVTYLWESSFTADFATAALTEATSATSLAVPMAVVAGLLDDAGVPAGGSATLHHRVTASDGFVEVVGPAATVVLERAGTSDAEPLPAAFAASPAYPNPARAGARLRLDLPWTAGVRVELYDLAGRQVAARTAEVGPGAGREVAVGVGALPSGTYAYRLVVEGPQGAEVRHGRITVVR